MKKNSSKIGSLAEQWMIKNKGILIICGIYVIVSTVLFLLMTGGKIIISNDSQSYISPAQHILKNGFFSSNGINHEYSRTPGYPLFLAIVYFLGGTNMTIVIAQIMLMAFKIYIFYKILIITNTPKRLSCLGSALMLVNPQAYGYSFSIITESLFGFSLILSLYFLVKYIYCKHRTLWFFLFSLSLNYALLVRPILLYFNILLCVALFLFLIIRKITLKCFAAFFLCFACLFGGWSFRNYVHSSVFIFTTINNNDVARLQTPVLIAYMNNMPYVAYPGYAEGISEDNEENLLREYPKLGGNDLNEAQKSLLRGKYGFDFIKNHFGDFVALNLKGFIGEMFSSFGTDLLNKSTGMSKIKNVMIFVQICFCVFLYIIYLLFFAGFIINIRNNKILNIGVFLICAYLSIPGAIYATTRFRDPFLPLILLSAIFNSPAIIGIIRSKLKNCSLKRFCTFLLE
jgi:4-amino-4-deoxy-L-arabinose transferase-like glycosyltransferase